LHCDGYSVTPAPAVRKRVIACRQAMCAAIGRPSFSSGVKIHGKRLYF
jgi:hypothetical protein